MGLWCHASRRGESEPKGEGKEDERVEDGRDEGLREGLQNYAGLSSYCTKINNFFRSVDMSTYVRS